MSFPGGGHRTYGGQDPNYNEYNQGGYNQGGYNQGGYNQGGNNQGGYNGGYGGPPAGPPPGQGNYGGGYGYGDSSFGGPPSGPPPDRQGGYNGGGGWGGGDNYGGYNSNKGNNGGYNSNNGGYNGYNQGGGYGTQGQLSHGNYDVGGGYGANGAGYNANGQWSGYQEGGYDDPSYGGSHSTNDMSFMPPPSSSQSWGVEGYTNYQYSQCTGRRKALLIGINYIGQKAQLKGCINDVHNIKKFLSNNYGYRDEDMVILTDDQSDQRSIPTKANILRACQWLVKDAQPNDSLFMHYSGHGGQTEDLDGDEEDGHDEVIYPVDYTSAGHIVDDDLHNLLVKPLPPGARLTVLMDCCHSATVLDLPYLYSTKGALKEPNLLKDTGKNVLSALSSYSQGDIGGLMSSVTTGIDRIVRGNKSTEKTKQLKTSPADVVMISGCKDNQTSADSFEEGSATGAMSHAFVQVMSNNKNQSYLSLINNMRDVLSSKYEQKPQLSCSHPLDCNLKFIM